MPIKRNGRKFELEPHTEVDFDKLDTEEDKISFCQAVLKHTGSLEEAIHDEARPILERYGSMIVIRFLSLVCNTRNSQLTCKTLAYASGISGQTLEEIAGEEGITKQAVDKLAQNLRDDLNLPPITGQKSEEARENMSRLSRERRLNQTLDSEDNADE